MMYFCPKIDRPDEMPHDAVLPVSRMKRVKIQHSSYGRAFSIRVENSGDPGQMT